MHQDGTQSSRDAWSNISYPCFVTAALHATLRFRMVGMQGGGCGAAELGARTRAAPGLVGLYNTNAQIFVLYGWYSIKVWDPDVNPRRHVSTRVVPTRRVATRRVALRRESRALT